MLTDKGFRGTVLLVDDEPHLLESSRHVLRREPLHVLTAHSGEAALRVLSEERVDVLITDEHMPGMSGTDLLRRTKQEYPGVIRILLTGAPSLDMAIKAINEGEVFRLLTKPCGPVDLVSTIRNALMLKRLAHASTRVLAKANHQREVMRRLERSHPGITHLERDESGAIMLDESMMEVDDLIGKLDELLEKD